MIRVELTGSTNLERSLAFWKWLLEEARKAKAEQQRQDDEAA